MGSLIEMSKADPADSGNGDHTMMAASRKTILIVDDEPAIGELLSRTLTSEGFVCRTFVRGQEALAALGQQAFDAVVSDLRMPEISGLDLLNQIRRTHPHIAFLMATGVDDIRVGVQAMKDGADDYLTKPFDSQTVVISLSRALEKKALEREVETYRKRLEEMVDQRTKQLQAACKRIERTYDDTLEALAAALDLRDNETAGHSRRVMRYCLEMAQAMGCTDNQLTSIARGAYLHDIGKIGIPDAILLKPGKLAEDERVVMETHVRIGYELVCRIPFLASAAEIVLTHQERYDGTGYPQGLMADEIPVGARIFAVADTFDAMTSDRPYRQALSYPVARDEIMRESGKQFDPMVVGVFLAIDPTVWEDIRKAREILKPKQVTEDMLTRELVKAFRSKPFGQNGANKTQRDGTLPS
ncbi:MAG: response regulator [Acidobacteriia bacterium]|nr:response regulator [Terriglobia bacterium]